MGLDMYLHASRYVGGWEHSDAAEKAMHADILKASGMDPKFVTDLSPSVTVNVCVAYWRKANQVHKWFVDNVQNGEDECKEHYVEREQLRTLRNLCLQAMETKDASLLPPQSGFFFGSTGVDEWYWEDLKSTAEQIERCLTLPSCWEFRYRSSW